MSTLSRARLSRVIIDGGEQTTLRFEVFAGDPPTYQYRTPSGETHHFSKPVEDGVHTVESNGRKYRFLGGEPEYG